jgi:hypothetical protein
MDVDEEEDVDEVVEQLDIDEVVEQVDVDEVVEQIAAMDWHARRISGSYPDPPASLTTTFAVL